MLSYYSWNTQNARKAAIFMEEVGLEYQIIPVNLFTDDNKQESFTQLNPNQKIPVLIDSDLIDSEGNPQPLAESGCILLYLAEKTNRFLPENLTERYVTLQWVFWQMSGLGPALGQLAHFVAPVNIDSPGVNSLLKNYCAKEVHTYPIERFLNESIRLLRVLETQLINRDYIQSEYSIADMAIYPWIESAWPGFVEANPQISDDFPNITQWQKRLAKRQAIKKVLEQYHWETDFTVQKT